MSFLKNAFFFLGCGLLLSCASFNYQKPTPVSELQNSVDTGPIMKSQATRVESSKPVSRIADPQAYFHYMQGALEEYSGHEDVALREYRAALAFDHDSPFLLYHI